MTNEHFNGICRIEVLIKVRTDVFSQSN